MAGYCFAAPLYIEITSSSLAVALMVGIDLLGEGDDSLESLSGIAIRAPIPPRATFESIAAQQDVSDAQRRSCEICMAADLEHSEPRPCSMRTYRSGSVI